MICGAFEGWEFADGRLACLGSPAAVYGNVVVALVGLVSVMLVLRSGSFRPLRFLPAVLFSLAALALGVTLDRPALRLTAGDEARGGSLVVLIDRSESFWRESAVAAGALGLAAQRIETFLDALPEDDSSRWRGLLMGFGAHAAVIGAETYAPSLVSALRRYREPAPEQVSDLATGLQSAATRLSAADGRRILVLVTDAVTDRPPDAAVLAELRAQGIAVHVVTAGATAPAAGLIAVDLGPENRIGETAILRGTVLGGGGLSAWQGSEHGRDTVQIDVPPGDTLVGLRLETRFEQRGLQGIVVGFGDSGPAGGARQERSLFTLVRGPVRLLVFGEAPWADGLPAARWQVERAQPTAPPAPEAFDIVVIDALSPAAFPLNYPDALLAAADGTGILLINGGLRGQVTEEQVISDWAATALSSILPVDSDPRLFVQAPPKRDVVIMVDVSGSMGGTRLQTARQAINAVLAQLRSRDTVTILPFAAHTLPTFPQSPASEQTLLAARGFVERLRAGGGTAPEDTIRASARFVSNYCAFFFISDADFAPPATAPQCFTTAISVSDQRFPMNISAWGEEIVVGEGGNASNLPLRYFEPEERDEYFRPDAFAPVPTGGNAALAYAPVVDGVAIAYPRSDAIVELLHSSPPPDPVFAWRRDAARSGVVAGAFLGPMGQEWGHAGLTATEAILERLLAWSDQERYLVRLTEMDDGVEIAITPLAGDSGASSLAASMRWADGSSAGISLAFDARRGAHLGRVLLPAAGMAQRALLVIEDRDGTQRIPVFIPQRVQGTGARAEPFDFGVNSELSRVIATQTGGVSLDRDDLPRYTGQVASRDIPVHAVFLALGFLLLALAVWSHGLRGR